MKVRELIIELSECPMGAEVVVHDADTGWPLIIQQVFNPDEEYGGDVVSIYGDYDNILGGRRRG